MDKEKLDKWNKELKEIICRHTCKIEVEHILFRKVLDLKVIKKED